MKDVKLTQKQIADRADALAQLIEQIQTLDADRKEITKDYTKRIDSLRLESTRLARIIRTGIETINNQMTIEEAKQNK